MIISLTEVGQHHPSKLAVCQSLGLSERSLVLPLAQAETSLEVHLAAGPSVGPVAQPLTGLLLVQSGKYNSISFYT